MKKKKAIARKMASKSTKKAAPAIGGTARGNRTADWPNVGRRRLTAKEDPLKDLSAAVKAAREAKKLTISSLATKLDIAPATLIKFEDRQHPVSIGIVAKLAEELGYTLTLTKASKSR